MSAAPIGPDDAQCAGRVRSRPVKSRREGGGLGWENLEGEVDERFLGGVVVSGGREREGADGIT